MGSLLCAELLASCLAAPILLHAGSHYKPQVAHTMLAADRKLLSRDITGDWLSARDLVDCSGVRSPRLTSLHPMDFMFCTSGGWFLDHVSSSCSGFQVLTIV